MTCWQQNSPVTVNTLPLAPWHCINEVQSNKNFFFFFFNLITHEDWRYIRQKSTHENTLAKFQGKSSYRNWYCKCTLINQHGMTRVNFCIHLWTTTSMKILVGFIKANKLNTSNRTLHHNSFEKWSSGKSTSLIEDEKWLSTLQDWNPSMKF